jgi:hypothetical protein
MPVALDTHRVKMVHHLQSKLLAYFSHLFPLNHCFVMRVFKVEFNKPPEVESHLVAFLKEPYTLKELFRNHKFAGFRSKFLFTLKMIEKIEP